MIHKVLLTKSGLEELQKEYNWRQNNERKRIADEIDKARQQGDLSENASYKGALESKEFNEIKIKDLEKLLQNSELIKENLTNKINVGSKVTLIDKSNGSKKTFEIVGENEADPSKHKISFKSPLAVELIGKKVGQKVEFSTQIGKTLYVIESIK